MFRHKRRVSDFGNWLLAYNLHTKWPNCHDYFHLHKNWAVSILHAIEDRFSRNSHLRTILTRLNRCKNAFKDDDGDDDDTPPDWQLHDTWHDDSTFKYNSLHYDYLATLLKLYICTLWRHITLSDPILAYLTTKSTISTASLANIVFHWVSQGKYCPCM